MLTEHFIASVGSAVATQKATTTAHKDAGIFLHSFQPLSQQISIYKKSQTSTDCLAFSPNHIFAAQVDKGVVHVYNRERGNQEATVPFTERISCITLACDDSVLVLGTVEGRIFLWETHSGRQITTSQAHLQPVTCLTVDPTGNFLLSASKDSSVHVWSLLALLSFSSTTNVAPLRTLALHRSEVTALVVGHSASSCNFAVSVSRDRTCLVWDYRTGNVLRTYLLPGVAVSVALDPADRAVYLGYEDGSIQQLDLYASPSGRLDAVANGSDALEPVQPSAATKWKLPDASHGAALCLSVSFDGNTIISGHQSGAILAWDVARRSFSAAQTQVPLPGPVTNIRFLPVTGFSGTQPVKKTQINEIVKPKFGAFDTSDSGAVPGNYALNLQLVSDLDAQQSKFQSYLEATTFPTDLLDEGLSELASWGKSGSQANGDSEAVDDDFMALNDGPAQPAKSSLLEENVNLKAQIAALKRVQAKSFDKIERLSDEKRAYLKEEQRRLSSLSGSKFNGVQDDSSDEDMG